MEQQSAGGIVDVVRTMYGYNTWANERILSTAEHLTPEQFAAEGSASFSSVRDTLVHTMWAQWNWLLRWYSRPNPPHFAGADYPDVPTLRARWAEIDRETHAFVAMLDDAALSRTLHYVNSRDEPMAYPLWQQVIHQVNHGTQHRSEVAAILTAYGHSPGWMDLMVYLDTLKE